MHRHTRDVVVKPRDVMPEGARTLPAPYYTDRGLLRPRARRAVPHDVDLRGPAGRDRAARPVRAPRASPATASSSRASADGGVHAFHNVCRHRGTRLCTEAAGTFAGSIQCPYHAWTYGLDGRLIGAPHMDEVPHFRKEDYPLHRVHADVWDGHVFLNLGRGAAAARGAARRSARQVPRRGAWRTCGSAAASSTTSRPTGS